MSPPRSHSHMTAQSASNSQPSSNAPQQQQPSHEPEKMVSEHRRPDRVDEECIRNHEMIEFLTANVPEYRRLRALRRQGWESPEGDEFFRKQRHTADNATDSQAKCFYEMMKAIGRELHRATRAFAIRATEPVAAVVAPDWRSRRQSEQQQSEQQQQQHQPRILDMCMAPGGFLATALEKNPGAGVLAFSLPPSRGGHKVRLPSRPGVDVRFLDVTMLAEDMGRDLADIPADHPDAGSFLPRQFGGARRRVKDENEEKKEIVEQHKEEEEEELFDLVLCDGQVLRTHARAPYRERREARRLTAAQLVLGLEHLRPGGTVVVLLHKVEARATALLLREFVRFSSVRLYKPARSHAKRSSFYMVARDVRSGSVEAGAAVERWRRIWEVATFERLGRDDEDKEGGEAKDKERQAEEEGEELDMDAGEIGSEELVRDFGGELVRLGRKVWEVQAEALEKASFIRSRRREYQG